MDNTIDTIPANGVDNNLKQDTNHRIIAKDFNTDLILGNLYLDFSKVENERMKIEKKDK